MQIKFEEINEQFEQGYFTLYPSEINEFFDLCIDEKDVLNSVKEKIEELISESIDSFLLSNIYFKYLTKIERNKPALVLAQYCVFPDDIKLDFPKIKITVDDKMVDSVALSVINQMKINTVEISPIKVDAVTSASIVTYDIVYYKNGLIFKEIKDQELRTYQDDENLCNLFIGQKLDSYVDIDTNDSNDKIIAHITDIVDYENVLLSDEIVSKINFLKTKNEQQLYEKVFNILKYNMYVEKYLNILITYYQKNKIIDISEEVVNFFKNVLNFEDENEDDIFELKGKIIKQMIATEIIRLEEGQEVDNENNRKIIQEDFELQRIIGMEERINYFHFYADKLCDLIIINYCFKNGILNKKY